MPYIKSDRRIGLDCTRPGLEAKNPGELNFVLSNVIDDYLLERFPLGYGSLNEVMGVLACIQQEVYRRIGAPHEDQKLAKNGEVFFSA